MEDFQKTKEQLLLEIEELRQQKTKEQALMDENERILITLGSITDGVITTDIEGKINLINKAGEELTGWTREEAVTKPLNHIFHIIDEKTHKRYNDPIAKILNPRGAWGLESHTILVSKDGTERFISDSGAYIRDSNNNIVGTVLAFRDITEKLRMEDELIRSSKMESIGILAGGIAHDFNNILTIILGNTSLAQIYAENGSIEKVKARLKDIEDATMQARDLTQQLLTFSRGEMPIVKVVSISNLLRDKASLALRGSNFKCEFSVPDDIWPVKVDEGQINQVINNLVINAKQAMPDGGILKISAKNIYTDREEIPLINPGRYIRIAVEDSGIGIPKEHLQKIFDPYFTTKPNGTGLGLPTSYSIIKKHGGHITVKSEPRKGTTFFVYLPAAEEDYFDETADKPVWAGGSGRVLVMDDEKQIREVVGMMLEKMGYTPCFAENGQYAAEIYKRARDEGKGFSAVIMDLTIPGAMGGKETIKKLLEIDPDVRAIVSSGYSNDPVMGNFRSYGFKGVVAKPYKIEELGRILQEITAGPCRK